MFLSLCRSCCRGDGPRRAGRQQLLVERRRPGHALQFPRSLPGLRRRSRSGPLHPAAGRNQLRLIHLGAVATRGGYQQHQSLPLSETGSLNSVLDLVRDLSFPTGLQQQELVSVSSTGLGLGPGQSPACCWCRTESVSQAPGNWHVLSMLMQDLISADTHTWSCADMNGTRGGYC